MVFSKVKKGTKLETKTARKRALPKKKATRPSKTARREDSDDSESEQDVNQVVSDAEMDEQQHSQSSSDESEHSDNNDDEKSSSDQMPEEQDDNEADESNGSAPESPSDENGEESDDIDGTSATKGQAGNVVTVDNDSQFFAATLQSLLLKKNSVQRKQGSAVLAKRKKTPMMKLIDEQRNKIKKQKEDYTNKQKTDDVGLELPSIRTKDLERDLRKIATKGVVALFNAIRSHQQQQQKQVEINEAEMASKKTKDFTGKAENTSSDKFIDLLKAKTAEVTKGTGVKPDNTTTNPDAKSSASAWSVLKDDYMLGAKLKDYDKEEDEDDTNGPDGLAAAAVEDDEFSD